MYDTVKGMFVVADIKKVCLYWVFAQNISYGYGFQILVSTLSSSFFRI